MGFTALQWYLVNQQIPLKIETARAIEQIGETMAKPSQMPEVVVVSFVHTGAVCNPRAVYLGLLQVALGTW